MNIATKPNPTSLAERIAKVRNRMLVETLTKVPPYDENLFMALCKIYEEQNGEKLSFSSASSDDEPLSLQELSFAHATQEYTRQQWPECVLTKKFFLGQVGDFDDNLYEEEEDEDFADWNKAR